MAKYLDDNGVLYFWQKIKNLFARKNESIKNITRSGTTFTATRADDTTFTFDQASATYDDWTYADRANGHKLLPALVEPTGSGDLWCMTRYGWAELAPGFYPNPNTNKLDFYLELYQDGGDSVIGDATVPMPLATASLPGVMSSADKTKLDALPTATEIDNTYAKKTDIAGMYKYKGSVASAAQLPSTGQSVGDVYNIETASAYGGAGANVAWNGTAWDSLGEIFSITSITNAEIDAIIASN